MIELRAPHVDDLDCYFEIFSDELTHHFIIDEGQRTREQSLQKLKLLIAMNGHEKHVYTIDGNDCSVGFVVVHLDGSATPFISYAIRRTNWRQGFALNALRKLREVEARSFRGLLAATHLDNFASQNLLLKAGFQMAGRRILPIGERVLYTISL